MTSHEDGTRSSITVDVEESIAHDHGRAVLLAKLRGLVDQGYRMILLNVAEVTYIDSVMLGVIVQAYTSALRSGTTLKLLHVTDRVRQLLRITKLDTVIDTVASDKDDSNLG
jgi:anti-sigma B factor antagonist